MDLYEIVMISVYFVGLFILCVVIRYREEDDAAYFFAVMWPMGLMVVPFVVVGAAGIWLGSWLEKRKRQAIDC